MDFEDKLCDKFHTFFWGGEGFSRYYRKSILKVSVFVYWSIDNDGYLSFESF